MSFVAVAIGGIAAGGAIGGALINRSATNKAVDAQTQAANYAADLQKQAADDVLAFQKEQWTTSQENLSPWLTAGKGALGALTQGLGIGTLNPVTTTAAANDPYAEQRTKLTADLEAAKQEAQNPDAGIYQKLAATAKITALTNELEGLPAAPAPTTSTAYELTQGGDGSYGLASGSLIAPWTEKFTAPDINESNDPGLAFRLADGQRIVESGAAARGGALSGGALKEAMKYNQNLASSEYGNVYNRALGEYQQAYNIFKNNQNDAFNKLSSVSGTGQTTANQLNSAGQNYANNAGNIIMGSAANQADAATQAANARASGYIANAQNWGNTISNVGNNLLTAYLNAQANKAPVQQTSGPYYI